MATIECEGKSRLAELRKYAISGGISNMYYTSTGSASDGVNVSLSDLNVYPQIVVYYVGGITYKDIIYGNAEDTTLITYEPQGYSSPDFIDAPTYKDPNKSQIVQNPKVYNDVFIVRQELSAFDKNYKLKDVKSLAALKTYASGRYFNIVSNS